MSEHLLVPPPAALPAEVQAGGIGLAVTRYPHQRAAVVENAAHYQEMARRQAESWRNTKLVRTPVSAADAAEWAKVLVPTILMSRHYRRLAALLAGEAGPLAGPTLGEELLSAARLVWGDHAQAGLLALRDRLREDLARALAEVESELAQWQTPAPPPSPDVRPAGRLGAELDLWWGHAAALLARKADLGERAAALAPPGEADPVKSAARHVARAVKNAGGRDRVAGRVCETWRLNSQWYDSPDLAEAERLAGQLDGSIAALGSAGASPEAGSHAAELVEQRRALGERVAALRAAADREKAAAAGALVDRALAGDGEARAALLETVRGRPSAFPGGLAEELDWKGPEEPLEALALELARGLAEPFGTTIVIVP